MNIDLDAMQLIRIMNLLGEAVDGYTKMQSEAREDGEDEAAFAYFLQARKHKEIITIIETQMKEQSK